MTTSSLRGWRALAATAAIVTTPLANATVVEIQTVLGNIQVNLFDQDTPLTVANFLDYVNNGAYTNSIIHRSATNFVIQGGGFTYDGALPFDAIPTNDPVLNEPVFSNVRGTIAMAKLAGEPNSATTQWFINLVDNPASLDDQSGGFSVFGVVMGDGMDVVDAIAALDRFNLGGSFTQLPLRDYTDFTMDPDEDNLVSISAIVVTDTNTNTNPDLRPPLNTTARPPSEDSGGGGGGGSTGLLAMLGLLALSTRRRLA
ncbi:MAG: peptidylprolyl isomerase [Pseudomonadota bacterium]